MLYASDPMRVQSADGRPFHTLEEGLRLSWLVFVLFTGMKYFVMIVSRCGLALKSNLKLCQVLQPQLGDHQS